MDDVDDVFDVPGVDELYEMQPSEFVAARKALASRLRADGDRRAAKAAEALRRPTVVAWALNQVARRAPVRIEELRAAGAAVREQQASVLTGGDPAALREAVRRRREVVTGLAGAAAKVAGAAHRDAAAAALEVASIDDDIGAALLAGRLDKEPVPSSDFGLAGMPDPVGPPAKAGPPPRARPDAGRRLLERAEEALAEAEARLTRAEERLADAQHAVDSARAAVDAARAERDRVRSAADVR